MTTNTDEDLKLAKLQELARLIDNGCQSGEIDMNDVNRAQKYLSSVSDGLIGSSKTANSAYIVYELQSLIHWSRNEVEDAYALINSASIVKDEDNLFTKTGNQLLRAKDNSSENPNRINRLTYIVSNIFALLALLVVLVVIVSILPGDENTNASWVSDIAVLIIVLLYIVYIAYTIGLSILRLHDFSMPGIYVLLSFVPLVGIILGVMLLLKPGCAGGNIFGSRPSYSGVYIPKTATRSKSIKQ